MTTPSSRKYNPREQSSRSQGGVEGAVLAIPFGSAIVAMAAAIVTIVNVVIAVVVEPQQS